MRKIDAEVRHVKGEITEPAGHSLYPVIEPKPSKKGTIVKRLQWHPTHKDQSKNSSN